MLTSSAAHDGTEGSRTVPGMGVGWLGSYAVAIQGAVPASLAEGGLGAGDAAVQGEGEGSEANWRDEGAAGLAEPPHAASTPERTMETANHRCMHLMNVRRHWQVSARTPYRIRTDDLRLERAVSWATRRTGQRRLPSYRSLESILERISFDILYPMKVLKVRRLGDSNIVVLPKELERLGYLPGRTVVVEALETGDVLIRPAEHLRAVMDKLARRVIEEDREALALLEAHDRGTAGPLTR